MRVAGYFSVILMLVFASGCVSTDSSSSGAGGDDTNQTIPGDDDNVTDPGDDNATDPGDDYNDLEPNEDQENSDFDTRGAILDPNACKQGGEYGTPLSHHSFNTVEASTDAEYGVEIFSRLPQQMPMDLSTVWLYYPNGEESDPFLAVGETYVLQAQQYRLGYSNAWVGQGTFYVRLPRIEQYNGYMGCYRYEIDSLNPSDIEAVKVYRLRE